jgi:hypothetical protein
MRINSNGDLLFPDTLPGGKVPKSVAFSCNVASTTVILAGITGIKLRVLAAAIGAGSAASFAFYASDTSLIAGPFYFPVNTNMMLPYNEVGWFQTSHGQPLEGWETAAAIVTGVLIYVED